MMVVMVAVTVRMIMDMFVVVLMGMLVMMMILMTVQIFHIVVMTVMLLIEDNIEIHSPYRALCHFSDLIFKT